jgi:iron complex outermembrane receptor protein
MLKTELSTGINNAGNTKYAASILPNAVGFKRTTASVHSGNLGIIMEGYLSYLLNSRWAALFFTTDLQVLK